MASRDETRREVVVSTRAGRRAASTALPTGRSDSSSRFMRLRQGRFLGRVAVVAAIADYNLAQLLAAGRYDLRVAQRAAGWVLRVLETKDLGPDAGGLRVRVALAAAQTEERERMLGLDSYVATPRASSSVTSSALNLVMTPRSARTRPLDSRQSPWLGWIDALSAFDGEPNLRPYVKPKPVPRLPTARGNMAMDRCSRSPPHREHPTEDAGGGTRG